MTTSNGVVGRLRAEAAAYREPGTDLYPEEANAGTARLLDEAADALDAAGAQVTRLTEALSERPEWLEDDELSDAFHAELKRQGAFSMEKHGTIALATAPFQSIIWDALRRTLAVDNPSPAKTSTGG